MVPTYPESRLLKVAELYYIERLSQSQIAAEMKISGATVSRMLNEALVRGMIHVEIRDPMKRSHDLERALEEITSGRSVSVPVTNPIGCNVKWEGQDKHWLPPEACDLVR